MCCEIICCQISEIEFATYARKFNIFIGTAKTSLVSLIEDACRIIKLLIRQAKMRKLSTHINKPYENSCVVTGVVFSSAYKNDHL